MVKIAAGKNLQYSAHEPAAATSARRIRPSADSRHGAAASVAAFHRITTDAIVVLSVFPNPGTGVFE